MKRKHNHNKSRRSHPRRPEPSRRDCTRDCSESTLQNQCRELKIKCSSLTETIEKYSEWDSWNRRYIHLLQERNDLLEALLTAAGCDFPPYSIRAEDYKRKEPTNQEEHSNISDVPEIPDSDSGSVLAFIDCDSCENLCGYYTLIDSLVQDILSLEEEMVNWRHALLCHLSPLDAQNLQSDIMDGLALRYYNNEIYQYYLDMSLYDEDPMESEKHVSKLWRLAHGTDEDSINL
ncbi:MAG: hypothetical protein LUD12_09450 [Lachnospiraceae bacterium]|nr:hypothetical protein [Lachnospiraceae bacterium]